MDTLFSENSECKEQKYECKICNYKCSKKQHIIQHNKTKKHIFNYENKNKNQLHSYICNCTKTYANKSGLWKHKKKCTYEYPVTNNINNIVVDNLDEDKQSINKLVDIINEQINEQQELKKILVEQNRYITEIINHFIIKKSKTNY
jgi:ferritin